MTSTYLEPFDFKMIFVNYFLGTQVLFAFAFIILLSYVAAKFQMSNMMFVVLLVVGAIMFAGYMGEAIYFFILVFLGFIIFKFIGKLVA